MSHRKTISMRQMSHRKTNSMRQMSHRKTISMRHKCLTEKRTQWDTKIFKKFMRKSIDFKKKLWYKI